MQEKDVVTILRYLGRIPDRIRAINREVEAIEDEYCPLKGSPTDGGPGSGGPGDSTASTFLRAEEKGLSDRLTALEVERQQLQEESGALWEQINGLDSRYKDLLKARYIRRYGAAPEPWGSVEKRMHYSRPSMQRMRKRALERAGEALEEMPMVEETLARARHARE